MNIEAYNNIYLIGIGGIGMSALARYFNQVGKMVAGYDLTPTPLTDQLQTEGIDIHFEDDMNLVEKAFTNPENTLIIYTPAIPKEHSELNYFIEKYFCIKKRAEVLGIISKQQKTIAVAGTHGKTTVSGMIAHILKHSGVNVCALLGGILKNYNSNYIPFNQTPTGADTNEAYIVVEADEFDRSFLQLSPEIAVITAIDEDHLDIYKDKQDINNTFNQFIQKITTNGLLIAKETLQIENNRTKMYKYSLKSKNSGYYAMNINLTDGYYTFDICTPGGNTIENIKSGIPGYINIENAVAAVAVANVAGIDNNKIREALKCYSGVKRRFEHVVRKGKTIFIDDYAHHPEELKACITSVRELYSGKKITGIFQPHLYSRTRDFAIEFGKSLSLLDSLILLDIYPAREKPIEGVTSQLIFDNVSIADKILLTRNHLLEHIQTIDTEVLVTIGAGDISMYVDEIKNIVSN